MDKKNKHKLAYDFIKNETKDSPKIYSYAEADGSATFLVMPSGDVYGNGYCEPFATLEEMRDDKNGSGSILQMFATEAIEPKKEEMEEFLEEYRSEYEGCNTSYKKEFSKRVSQLEKEIEQI